MGHVLLPSRNVYIFVLLKKINDTNTTISPQNRNKYYYLQNLEGENHMDVAVVDQMDELLEFGQKRSHTVHNLGNQDEGPGMRAYHSSKKTGSFT